MRRALLTVAALLLLPGCTADGRLGGTIITAGDHATDGATLDGLLVVVGGEMRIGPDAAVDGPAFVAGGELTLSGAVKGDLSVLHGRVVLGPRAVVGGDLRHAGGELVRDPGARIDGAVVTGASADAVLGIVDPGTRSLGERLARFAAQALLLAAAAAALGRWLRHPMRRVGRAAHRRPLLALALGALTVLVGLPLIVFMAFTVVLIPVALVGVLLGVVAVAYGWAAIGLRVGRRLAAGLERAWTPGWAALIGTLALTAGAGLVGLVPVLGDVVVIGLLLTAIGATMLTRLGSADAGRR